MWSCFKSLSKDRTPTVLFSSLPFTITLANSNMTDLRYEWIWEKEQGTGYLNSRRMPLKIHENILVFYKHLPVYNPQMRNGKCGGERIIKRNGKTAKTTNYGKHVEISESKYTGRYPIDILEFKRDKNKLHPTQKPVELLEYLIKTYTNEGDIVLDCCMGSGSTGVACQNTGRDFIGIELNEEYFEIAEERLKENDKQQKLNI